MKNALSKHLIIALLATALPFLNACKKHSDDPAPSSSKTYSSADDFISKNEVPSQFFTLNASTGGTITGSQGTSFKFPAYAFKDQSGNTYSGNVKIEIKEVLKPKDMLFSGVLPISNGKPLVSGGEVYIKVTPQLPANRLREQADSIPADSINDPIDGDELQLNDSTVFEVRIPVDTTIGSMQLFQGSMYNSNVNWVILQNQSWWTNSVNSFTNPYQGYFFTCHSLHWINVDSFMEGVVNGSWTSLTCQLPNGFNVNNTNLYVYYNGLNAIFPINRFSSTLTSYEVMSGMDITIVGIGTDSHGQLYSVFHPMKVTPNCTVQLNLNSCTADEFKTQMDALP